MATQGRHCSLRIGDIILLKRDGRQREQEANVAPEGPEIRSGYVFSELRSSEHNAVALLPNDYNLPNVHFATFRVLAANKYKAQERLNILSQKQLQDDSEDNPEVLQAKRALEIEQRENDAKQERLAMARKTITYGMSIQLQHVLTKKYLAVSNTDTSRTDKTKLRANLQTENGEGCIFKILLCYKAHSVGDQVHYDDQVKLESVKTEGQFLHCSAKLFGDAFAAHGNCYEMNLAATGSALTIVPHYQCEPNYDPKALRAGSTVRLYHRKQKCCVVAEGSFAGKFAGQLDRIIFENDEDEGEETEKEDPSIIENVHCRERHSDHGILRAPSTSANTFWQLEKGNDPHSGEPLKWGEECRIKHLPTRQYLAVQINSSQYKVTLTANNSDRRTVFQLHPVAVIQERNTVHMESCACINHPATKTWLHLEKSERHMRSRKVTYAEDHDHHEKGYRIIEETAELFALKATKQLDYDDAFILEQVDSNLLDDFGYVAGIVPILTSYIRYHMHLKEPTEVTISEQAKQPGSSEVDCVASAINELAKFLTHWQEQPVAEEFKQRETKNRQKLLRNLQVLNLVINILVLSAEDRSASGSDTNMCKVCIHVILNYLKGKSHKNKNYLSTVASLFKRGSTFPGVFGDVRHVKDSFVDLILSMFKDNSALIKEKEFVADITNYLFTELKEEQSARLLRSLGELCDCSGKPVPANQELIVDLLRQHKVYYRTKVENIDGTCTVMFQKQNVLPEQLEWVPLKNVAGKDIRSLMHLSCHPDCDFLKAQLELFAKLCKGNNLTTIVAFRADEGPEIEETGSITAELPSSSNDDELRYVTFEEIFQCASDDKLDQEIRVKYVDLMIAMYIEVGANRAYLDNLPFSVCYSDMNRYPFKEAGENPKEALTKVKNRHFPKIKEWINKYLKNVEKLVADDDQTMNLLLVKVLDMLAILVKYGYYDCTKDVDDILKRLVSILNGFTDFPSFSASIPTLDPLKTVAHRKDIKDFREHRRYKKEGNVGNSTVFAVKQRAMDVLDLFFNYKFCIDLMHFIYDFRLLRKDIKPDEWTSPPDCLCELWQPEVPDVATAQNPCMVKSARKRLSYIFSHCEFKHEDHGKTLQDILLDLTKYEDDELVQRALHLLMRIHSAEAVLFSKATQTQLLCTERSMKVYALVESKLPTLRHHMSVEADSNEEMVEALHFFTELCVSEKNEQQNEQNQRVLYNFGVLSDVLKYVLQQTKEMHSLKGRKRIARENLQAYVECLKLLKALCHGNAAVRERVFDHLSQLLEIKVEDEVGMRILTSTIANVFQEAKPEVCLKLTEQQIRRILQLVFEGGEIGREELVSALHSISMVHQLDLPVRHNQILIIKHFSIMREKMDFCTEFLGELKEEKCLELLNEKTDDRDKSLQLLLMVTDLLATCTVGENKATESICWTVFTVEELLTVLNSTAIPLYRKRPFARFLVWVYMNAGGSKMQKGASHLSHSNQMWNCLWKVETLLEGIARGKTFSSTEHLPLEERECKRVCSTHASYPEGHRASTPEIQSEGSSLKTDDVLLEYLTDGMLPLLKCFYTKFYKPREEETEWSSRILSVLLDRYGSLAESSKYVQYDPQMKRLHLTILSLLKCIPLSEKDKQRYNPIILKCGNAIPQIEQEKKLEHGMTLNCPGNTAARQDPQMEIQLNKEFHVFVANYRLAYQGPNTAQAQIGSKLDEEVYSDFEDEVMQKPGPEYLPLGPSFQELKSVLRPHAGRLLYQIRMSLEKLNWRLTEEVQHWHYGVVIQCLRVLRAIIHNEIKSIDPELKDRDPKKFRSLCKKKLYPVQDEIQDLAGNAVAIVMPLLSHHNEELACEVLAFLKAILYSGNPHVEKAWEEEVRVWGERLFHTMQKMLHTAAFTYRERQELIAQVKARNSADEKLRSLVLAQHQTPNDVSLDMGDDQSLPPVRAHQMLPKGKDLEFELKDIPSSPHQISFSRSGSTNSATLPPKQYSLVKTKSLDEQRSSIQSDFTSASTSADDDASIALLNFQDLSYIKLAIGFLGQMCDGQRTVIQDYLRDQNQTIHSINMVAEVADFMQNFYRDLSAETFDLVHLLLQTLIEMCVGNYKNQEIIFNKQIIVIINRILLNNISDYDGEMPSSSTLSSSKSNELAKKRMVKMKLRAIDLKGSAVELLEAMLEETSHHSKDLRQLVAGVLDVNALYNTLADFYKLKDDPDVKRKDFDDDAQRGLFRTYHILLHLADCTLTELKPDRDAMTDPEGSAHLTRIDDALVFCEKRSRSVEVVYSSKDLQKGVLTRVHFWHDPKNGLRDEVMRKVMWNVERNSLDDKLRDFLDWMKAVKIATVHHNWLKKHFLTKLLIAWSQRRRWTLLFLSVIMNILLLVNYIVPNQQQLKSSNATTFESVSGAINPDVFPWFGNYVLYILGSLHLILSLWMVAEYIAINWRNFTVKLPDLVNLIIERMFVVPITHLYRLVKCVGKRVMKRCKHSSSDPLSVKTPDTTPGDEYSTETANIRSHVKTSYSDVNILGLKTIYVVAFLLASVLSLAFRGYFYCICLLYMVIQNDILKRALRSVTKNGWALLNVALLGLAVLYIYAVISFAFLHESFLSPDAEVPLFCNTLTECFVSIIRYGLIDDSLGLIVPLVPADFRTASLRLLFDVSFFVIVTTIGLTIVFGIIVDSFSQLRDERLLAEKDMKTCCFICGIASHEFNQKYKGFADHVEHDHSMWSYIYYSIYLDQIDTSDHNAIESYVYKMIGEGKVDFFPIQVAKVLVTQEPLDEQLRRQTKQQLEELELKLAEQSKEQSYQLEVKLKEQSEEQSKLLEAKLKEQSRDQSDQLEDKLKGQSREQSDRLEAKLKEQSGQQSEHLKVELQQQTRDQSEQLEAKLKVQSEQLEAKLKQQSREQSEQLEAKLTDQNEQSKQLEAKLKQHIREQNEQLEAKLKDYSGQLEVKQKEQSEQNQKLQESVEQLLQYSKLQQATKKMEEQVEAKMEDQTKQLACEVATLRETLEKLITQMATK